MALVLVAGGAVAFASQSLTAGRDPDAASATAPPPPAPALLAPSTTITKASTVDLNAIAPTNLRRDQQYVLRIYVNGDQVIHEGLPSDQQFSVSNIPLNEGDNSIQASLVDAGGESPLSAPVEITRDDVAPNIQIQSPTDKVYTDAATLKGTTEAGATIAVADGAGNPVDAAVSSDGRFSADLELGMGNNSFVIKSTDEAGNTAVDRITIVRAPSSASIELTVTPTTVYSGQLPVSVDLEATLRDELGRPVNGVTVVFGISPPNAETMTYQVTAVNGRAHYSGLVLNPGSAPGPWLVTALAELPSGDELRENSSFNLQSGAPKPSGQH